MFGIYRTLLALGIVCVHLGGLWRDVGPHLVFGFYVLSGYLMTLIMHKSYGYTKSGMWYFAVNRFLRVYPIYWATIILSLILMLIFGETISHKFHDAMFFPATIKETLQNVLLIFSHDGTPRISPPAWALTVELFFYVAICLGLSRNKLITWVWLIGSIIYHVVALYMHTSWGPRYYPIYAGSLPFAVGALVYHYRSEWLSYFSFRSERLNHWVPMLVAAAMMTNWVIGYLTRELRFATMYSSIILSALMVLVLSDKNLLPNIPKSLDKWIGDLSYPIYLNHMLAGLIIYSLLNMMGIDDGRQSPQILVGGTIIVLLISWVLAVAVGEPIENLRELVKKILARSSSRSGIKSG
jgi:peptidoglycan/LPS O-acetylase OafA/YrhL